MSEGVTPRGVGLESRGGQLEVLVVEHTPRLTIDAMTTYSTGPMLAIFASSPPPARWRHHTTRNGEPDHLERVKPAHPGRRDTQP
jgi:hypothetical protein